MELYLKILKSVNALQLLIIVIFPKYVIVSSLHRQESTQYDTSSNLFICKDYKICWARDSDICFRDC